MCALGTDTRPNGSLIDWPGFLVAAIAGSLVSLAITGFLFAISNNLFHLPIVADLYDEPQFAQDSFIQSLRYFSAGPWLLLHGTARYIGPYFLFLILALLSRFLSFAGFLACAQVLGVKRRKERALFSAIIGTTFLLRGSSFAGNGGLFINYFTHSEIANGLFLLALYLLLQRRIVATMAFVGLVFFVNAFMGVWTAAALAPVFLVQLLRAELPWHQTLFRAMLGLCVAGLFAAPVILSVLSNPEFGKPLTFDYVAYLSEYWPYHFIFGPNSLAQKIGLALIVALGCIAFALQGKPARLLMVVLTAFCVIYLVGIVAPYVTHSAAVLNLHLLRASAMLQLLAALPIAALATLWWFDTDRTKAKILAPTLVVALSVPTDGNLRYAILGFLFFFAFSVVATPISNAWTRLIPGGLVDGRFNLRFGAILWLICAIPFLINRHLALNLEQQAWIDEWRQAATWARANTSPGAKFLVPAANFGKRTPLTLEDVAGLQDVIFEFASHRRVWVDFKRGAAVMWLPSYYDEWHRRVTEVSALATHQDRLDYARRNGLDFVVEVCLAKREENVTFATNRLCVYPALPRAQTAITQRAN